MSRRLPSRPDPTRALCGTLVLAFAAACAGGESPEAGGGETPEGEVTTLSGVGFETPESVLHDAHADVYLVSNIAGSPLEKDDNGFISRVSPEGEVEELRWIDGADEAVQLHAPKGMIILGDSLYVADIDCVRIFGRTSGEPAGEVCFPEATFLNDVAVDENNVLYVTDMGMQAGAEGLEPSGSDAIYRFAPSGRRAKLLEGDELGQPNGLTFGPRGGFVVTRGTGEIYQITPEGTRNPVLPPSERQLDGVVFTPDGGFLFSNWADSTVYRVAPDGTVTKVVEGVPSPADIGFDASRSRLLIPVFLQDEVWLRDVPGVGAGPGAGEQAGG